MKRRRQITIETWRLVLVKRRKGGTLWCPCRGRQSRRTADKAAVAAGTSMLTIFRRVEAGELHFRETVGGALLIRADS
jgi:hypothetical protein